jgi:hypothetical protein
MKTILDRITLPTRIVVNRAEQSASGLAVIVQEGAYCPAAGDTCEMESGGQVLARGRIVRRRGGFFFKVIEVAGKEGTA